MKNNAITLCTSQWVDLPLEILAEKASSWGFDGLELSCGGDHFDVEKCLSQDYYVRKQKDILNKFGLSCFAISNHLIGQCVCDDPIDERHRRILPKSIWGDGDPEGVRERAAEELKNTAKAANLFGAEVVTCFTGSSIWSKLYFFPPLKQEEVDRGYQDFADRFIPILDVFNDSRVKFALEVHPTEIAYDCYTLERSFEAINFHPAFGINFDPSHLIHQFVDPVYFVDVFGDRIFHVHIKDSTIQLNGRNSILCSHLNFGDPRRGWDFVSPGHGDVNWDRVMRALNRKGYSGPLSIEWEDSGMDRDWGAKDSIKMIKRHCFKPSNFAFDSAFEKKED